MKSINNSLRGPTSQFSEATLWFEFYGGSLGKQYTEYPDIPIDEDGYPNPLDEFNDEDDFLLDNEIQKLSYLSVLKKLYLKKAIQSKDEKEEEFFKVRLIESSEALARCLSKIKKMKSEPRLSYDFISDDE